jgi:hypothetical protein
MRFHVIYSKRRWRWYREGNKIAYMTHGDKSKVMVAAVYRIEKDGGDLIVHNKDGTVDFVLDNWSE